MIHILSQWAHSHPHASGLQEATTQQKKSNILRLTYYLKMLNGQWRCNEWQANLQREHD